MATTAQTSARYLELDAVRGFAVMGILAMNIIMMALPGGSYFNPLAYGYESLVDGAAWLFNFVFVDSKMRGLFSILFGASAALVIERAAASGQSPARVHYARMLWLLVFGMIHFYFIWEGDILALYAQCGLVLFFFRNLSIPSLRKWAIGLFSAQFLLFGLFSAMFFLFQGMADSGTADAEQLQALAEINADFGNTPEDANTDLQLYKGGYAEIVSHRTGELAVVPFIAAFNAGLETLGLMLIGMALYKSGMLTGQWEMARYRRWAVRCFAIAIPPLIAIAWLQYALGFSGVSVFASSLVLSMPFDVIMAIGWAALLIIWIKSNPDSTLIRRVACVGRAAFTNYLGTSIVMTLVFYGYGLNLYGEINRAALYLFVFAMWALMLLWSQPWLMRFRYGPLEWLWRSLARGKVQRLSLG
ncbi:DUF418 domain-containing protein [Alterisphingorhabdus coralli]|uniref:DUF418 domain-containing protein n=1 Tax=Alterisphingorhabdus coralli TaxID=3071408 RepID=A0AA97F9F0_9SPHN|nr:DUF418 domain-containing protein [Parasphingorhabdus sp. SCSIO 66989]WOE75966.1 DUF418 domain-containing protein [Parasphingorhabdus sp. SCSIO 66989]